MKASITIDEAKIRSSLKAKYLDVIFDQKLKFRSHINYAVAKDIKHASAIAGIAKSKWRPEFKYLRRLFITVTTARMNYAAIIWHRPEDTRTAPITTQLRALSSVQDRVMQFITGCFRTTAITVMKHEINLLSPQ